MQWGWRASFKQSLKKDKKCVTYKARLGDTGAWQVLHIDCEGRLAQFLSTEHRKDCCRSKLNDACGFLNRNRLVLNTCGASHGACVPVCYHIKYSSVFSICCQTDTCEKQLTEHWSVSSRQQNRDTTTTVSFADFPLSTANLNGRTL